MAEQKAETKAGTKVVDATKLAKETPEKVEIPAVAKEELFKLIVQAASKDPAVTNFVNGLSVGLGLSGRYFLDFSTFAFVKQKEG